MHVDSHSSLQASNCLTFAISDVRQEGANTRRSNRLSSKPMSENLDKRYPFRRKNSLNDARPLDSRSQFDIVMIAKIKWDSQDILYNWNIGVISKAGCLCPGLHVCERIILCYTGMQRRSLHSGIQARPHCLNGY